ncbi:MAG: DUF1476 family protein [Kordiimonadaceae bacterium]|nr:DUF1476 family protein [Kordiimonadaceae bacterium]MBO6569975.1 DUF1476 family protein [Kordiimonadaceae bacterium]MBO6965928.1 DUF1476 family protein [Kordiimonadaceae bacterium]
MSFHKGSKTISMCSKLLAVGVLSLTLVSCGEDEAVVAQRERFEAYSQADLEALLQDGEGREVINAINYYRNEAKATDEHLFLLARTYVSFGGGIAAEETIYRLHNRGYDEAKTALVLAQALVLQGKNAEAEAILAKNQAQTDEQYARLVLQGDIMLSLREFDQAEALYLAAVEAEPNSFRGYLAAALFYLQTGNLTEAAKFAEQASALEFDDPMVSYAQGMVARYSGRIADAKQHFLDAINANGSDTLSRLEVVGIMIAEGEFEAAQEQLDAIYAVAPINPVANYYSALILVRNQEFDQAEDLLLRTGDFTRDYPLAAQVYGFVSYELAKYSTAIPYLERALSFFPNDADTRLALADSLARRGRSQEALDILQPLIESGDDVTALVHATAAAAGLGKVKEARQYIEQAVEVAQNSGVTDPETLQTITRRAAFARFLDDDLDGATALLDAMYADNADDVESLTNKANLFLAAGDLERAQTALNQLASFDPDSAVVANLQGAIYHRQKRYPEAVEFYSKSISTRPQYQSALKNRAFAYIQQEDYERARADIEALLQLTEPDPQLRAMYGRSLLETGAAQAALDQLNQAAEDLPDFFIVHADRAEALAELGHYSRAISIAGVAKRAARYNTEFNAYMDEKVAEWEAIQEAQEQAAEEERQERLAKAEEERKEEQARQQAILEEAGDLLDEEDDQTELMAELERIAEENRKLRAEEEQAALEQALEANQLTPEQAEQQAREQRVRDARNQYFGLWLANEIGLTGEAALQFAAVTAEADKIEPGDTDLIRKAIADIEAAGLTATIQSIEAKLAEFREQALQSDQQDQ